MTIYLDLETRSYLDLTKVGAYKYAEQVEMVCAAWAVDDEPVQGALFPGQSIPEPLWSLLKQEKHRVIAHNANFERVVLKALADRGESPMVKLSRWRCTRAQACVWNYQPSLEMLAQELGLAQQKDTIGSKAMLKVAQGKRIQADLFNDQETVLWNEDPQLLAITLKYCKQDVEVLRAIHKVLPEMPEPELRAWQADQRVNDRGFAIDKEMARNAGRLGMRILDQEVDRLTKLTNGISPTRRKAFAEWLEQEEGVVLENTLRNTVDTAILQGGLSERARAALEGFRLVGAGPTKKYAKFLERVCRDGRIRGEYRFADDLTLRWSAHGVQVHNLAARLMSEAFFKDVQASYAHIAQGKVPKDADNPLAYVGMGVRGVIAHPDVVRRKPQTRDLLVCDWSSIEPRLLALLSGDDAFLDFVRKGKDVYVEQGKLMINDPTATATTKIAGTDLRVIGKYVTLSLGYGMGRELCEKQIFEARIVPEDEAGQLEMLKTIDPEAARRKSSMTPLSRLSAAIVKKYRKTRAPVPAFWKQETTRAVAAIKKGKRMWDWHLEKFHDGTHLVRDLPSGRPICLHHPFISSKGDVCYMAGPGKVRELFGGKIAALVVQSMARDLMARAIWMAESAGLRVVMHTHDEMIVEEVKASDEGTLKRVMSDCPEWAYGLPVECEVERKPRYSK